MQTSDERLRAKIPGAETGVEVRQTICDMCCPSFHCGIDAYVKDGEIIKVEGTEEHPLNHGLLCTKGLASRQYIYREDRIKTPLKRVGARGSGEFRPISWEEAYAEISERLLDIRAKHGAESVVFFSGYTKWYRAWLQRLAYSFGSLNYATESSLCMTSTFLNWLVTTGNRMSTPDVARAGVFLGWAYNPYYSRYLAAAGVEERKKQGMKVIIIDPRVTNASLKLADLHLRPRAGTDGALALALAHLLIRDGKIDRDYIERNVYGFEQFADYVKAFTPAEGERLTGVPADLIEQAARMIGENLPLAINESAAPIAHHINGFQSYRAIMALSAITGSFDRAGGQLPCKFSYNYQAAGFETREHRFIDERFPEHARPPVGAERFPLWNAFIDQAQVNDLARQIKLGEPYPLKAMIGFGVNHRIAPDSNGLRDALMQMDFLVNTELFLTDTCKFCDIVLPACTSFERSELKVWGGGYLTCTNPVIPPLFNSRPDVQIICDLAKTMQLGDPLLEAGPDECMRYMIADLPVTLEQLRSNPYPTKLPNVEPYLPGSMLEKGLATESGKFELYSLAIEKFQDRGLEPLPVYHPPLDEADAKIYPFQLCSAPRLTNTHHTRLHNVAWCRSMRPYPMADLSPVDAARLGIAQEDDIELFTKVGSICVKANLTDKVDEGTVYMTHGYSEADVNTLMNADHLDPYSGFPGFRSTRVGVRKKVEHGKDSV